MFSDFQHSFESCFSFFLFFFFSFFLFFFFLFFFFSFFLFFFFSFFLFFFFFFFSFFFFFFFFSLFHCFFETFSFPKGGETPLYVAAKNGHKQIVQLLLEKAHPNVNLVNKVYFFYYYYFEFIFWILDFFILSFSLSHFSFFFFLNVKNGETPLFIAAQNGYDQIVQILLEKGKPNVDLANKVFFSLLFLFMNMKFLFFFFHFFIFFFFHFLIFRFFFLSQRKKQLLFLLLLKKDMNKLFNFYWKKETQMLILQRRLFC